MVWYAVYGVRGIRARDSGAAVGVPAHCGGLDQMGFKGLFQIKPFCDPMIKGR